MAVIHKVLDKCSAEELFFMRMKSISISTQKSVQTGNFAASKSELSRWGRMKNVILPGHCIAAQEKSAMWMATAKVISLLKHLKVTYRRAKIIMLIVWITTLSIKVGKRNTV
ncbi:hypothetical protein GM30_23740 [Trabulsiella odontotermitis]|nr:hypothetical protein GM30_23740 [Trabulsiella odontotermitis]